MFKELKPVIYVAGRYSDGGKLTKKACAINRQVLRDWSIKFVRGGWAVISPIENDEWMIGNWKTEAEYLDIIASDCALLERCDAIFLCPGWEGSRGAQMEFHFAQDNDITIFQLGTLVTAKEWLAQQASVVDMWRCA